MAKGNTLTGTFENDKTTKNKERFGEIDGEELQGVLYVPKAKAKSKRAKVTIEFLEDED